MILSPQWKEGTYRFISEANKQQFLKKPSTYVPQYGGYCACGTAKGKKFDGDPRLFKAVDDNLYFNLNRDVYKKWLADPNRFIISGSPAAAIPCRQARRR